MLDRWDRKRLMIASDLFRAVIAVGFSLSLVYPKTWVLYLMSFLLMFASPFFTSGRAAVLPSIANKDELHTANTLTQTTQWTTIAVGSMLGGASVMQFGFEWAFLFNALSFLISALCISQLHVPSGFRPPVKALTEQRVLRPWHEYREGLTYMRRFPLLFGIALIHVGWATGGGAAQVLFPLFGEKVFHRGPGGIGVIWGCAAIGLLVGGAVAQRIGGSISFSSYKWTLSICYIVHGLAYVAFSQMREFWVALVLIALSRAAVGVTSILNMTQMLRHVPNQFRGRVFSTIESLTWGTMMFSMTLAAYLSDAVSLRTIGAWSGLLSATTAIGWTWANLEGRIPEPPLSGVEPEEVEMHGEPAV
jgi:MFS family permease